MCSIVIVALDLVLSGCSAEFYAPLQVWSQALVPQSSGQQELEAQVIWWLLANNP